VGDREAFIEAIAISRDELSATSTLHFPDESDDELFSRQLRLCTEGDRDGSAWRRVALLGDGTLAGMFNLNEITRGLLFEGDANWWVRSDLSGRGLGTQGVRLLLRHALGDLPSGLGLHRVTCGIRPENIASKRVAQKAGFVRQPGVMSHLQVGAQWTPHEVYVATPDSFAG